MDITVWQTQLRRGAAELVVLSVCKNGERYGLEILEAANRGGEMVAEGALYPLLNRLEKEGKLTSRWVTDESAHPRKYYTLTPDGAALLAEMVAIWTSFRRAMTAIVEKNA